MFLWLMRSLRVIGSGLEESFGKVLLESVSDCIMLAGCFLMMGIWMDYLRAIGCVRPGRRRLERDVDVIPKVD